MNWRGALLPRVPERFGRAPDFSVQPGANAFAVVDQKPLQLFDADALDEVIRTLQIFGVLAEGRAVLPRPLRARPVHQPALHRAEHVALSHAGACSAANIYFPAASFDCDDTDVLDHRFRTIARAA